jgi:hypothetical protein
MKKISLRLHKDNICSYTDYRRINQATSLVCLIKLLFQGWNMATSMVA